MITLIYNSNNKPCQLQTAKRFKVAITMDEIAQKFDPQLESFMSIYTEQASDVCIPGSYFLVSRNQELNNLLHLSIKFCWKPIYGIVP